MQSTGKRADDAQIWPWLLARRVAWGIMRLSASRRVVSATAGDAFATTLPCVPGVNRIAEDGANDIDDASSYVTGANRASKTTPSGFYLARAGGADDRIVSRCPGCARHRPQDHEQHSRVQGVCRYPHIETKIYRCPGCCRDLPRHHPNHTLSTLAADRCRVGCMQRNEQGNPRGRASAGPRPAANEEQIRESRHRLESRSRQGQESRKGNVKKDQQK